MSEANVSIEVQLATIAGKVDLVAATAGRTEADVRALSEGSQALRDAVTELKGLNIQERLTAMNTKVDNVLTRVDAVEAKQDREDGKQTGIGLAVRVMWAFAGAGTAGAGALIARALGV